MDVEPSYVISALQILVSPRHGDKAASNSVSSFTEVLLENISTFEKIIQSEQRFQQFNEKWKSDRTVSIETVDISTWRFVLYCLKCLHLLQQSLNGNVEMYSKSPQPARKPSAAPTMSPDTLSINEQKVVKTAVQFIVCIGICPRLQIGVGIPIECRSGFSYLVQKTDSDICLSSTVTTGQLFSCIKILLSCTTLPALGTLILTQHLTDILAALFQLCHSVSRDKSESNRSKVDYSTENILASSAYMKSIENTNPAEIVDIVRAKSDEKCKNKGSVDIRTKSSDTECDKNDTKMVTADKYEEVDTNGTNTEATTEVNIEKCDKDLHVDFDYCKEKLEELIRKVYPPLLVRTLMLLQGGPTNKRPKNVPAMPPAPKWLRQECSKCLASIIMRPKGVQSVIRGMLDVPGAGRGMTDAYDWRKCDAVAKVISGCPLHNVSSEMYYKAVGLQVLDLLHIKDVQVCKQFLRVACCLISNMATQQKELTQIYVMQLLLKPLLMCLENSVSDNATVNHHIVVEEMQLTTCIEDCQKVFVSGGSPNPELISYLQPVFLTLFDLFVFTSQGVSNIRSSCQELLTTFLKEIDSSVTMTCLESMAFKQVQSGSQLPRKHKKLKFANGDNGGVVVVMDLTESESDYFDDSCVNCIVNLMEDLQTTDIPGQFLVYMLQELTQFIQSEIHGDKNSNTTQASGDTDEGQALIDIEVRYQSAMSQFNRKLTLLNILAAVCEKLGPSCIKNAHHTIDFVKATLERGVQICENTEDLVFEAFENETITMAIGLVTALMTGAFEMNDVDRKYLQELLPLLDQLSRHHPDSSVKEMATDIRIAIATHGAVWSEITKERCQPFKQDSKKESKQKSKPGLSKKPEPRRKIVEISSSETVETISDKDKLKSHNETTVDKPHDVTAKATYKAHSKDLDNEAENNASENHHKDIPTDEGSGRNKGMNDVLRSKIMKDGPDNSNSTKTLSELDMAFKELCDPLVPVRGHGLIRLYHLVEKRDPAIHGKQELLLKIFEENLDHGDSYIYLSAVKGLTALCEEHAALVVPRVCQQFADYRKGKDGNEGSKSPELRMKLGEIIVKASRCLGDLLPQYRDVILPSVLSGVKDEDPFVRASSLSNLGEICKLLQFSLGNIIQEVFNCCSNTLKHDKDVQVRKAAAQALTLLLQGLGSHIFKVLESILRDLYRVLKSVMQLEKDEGVKLHVHLALNELDDLMRDYLFPEQKLEKRIRVLDFN